MAFTFKKNKSVRRSVKRLARKRISRALEHLEDCDKLEAVHEVRKDIKQLRALLRLVRAAMPKSQYRCCSRVLRKAAGELGAARDAHVKVNALAELIKHYKKELPPRAFVNIKKVLAADCEAEQSRLAAARAPRKVRKCLVPLCKDRDSFRLKRSGWAAIGPGIRRSYKCGRRAFELAHQSGKPPDFHEWRKRVKDLFYQIGLLEPIWPEQLGAAKAELKQLGEYLGDDHDLFLLTEPGEIKRWQKRAEAEVDRLAEFVARRQWKLRRLAMGVGSKFYREMPSVFCKRLAQYWTRWRHKPKSRAVTA
jgi:CHAD domain-containing protein